MAYTLHGAPLSLHTGNVRSYLRRQDIDFREETPGGERCEGHREVWVPLV